MKKYHISYYFNYFDYRLTKLYRSPLTLKLIPPPAEINFSEGKHIDITDADDIPETYRMTHFGQDVSNLEQGSYSNVPIASINFEDYKDRESRMVPSESKDSVVVQQQPDLGPPRPDQKSDLKSQPQQKNSDLLEEKSDFNLEEDYNMKL